MTLPLYPLIMLAIWFEDGRPFFFGHRRETIGGRTALSTTLSNVSEVTGGPELVTLSTLLESVPPFSPP